MRQVVAALFLQDNKILICQRTRHQSMPLKWEFPGGKIEPGEQPHEALVRELEEELGVVPVVGPEVARIKHTYRNGAAVNLRFYLIERYEGEIDNRIFRDVRWVERPELPTYDFLEADLELVRDLATGKIV
ncbi:MAG TPA: (deoxy)nucleoside triphosphate pyrophosphohydrolase [Terriglobales bacterium]|nr:(deoxy)nucleoside triphosphate pyrophosphohydrolase [Terriglobales bacterium]